MLPFVSVSTGLTDPFLAFLLLSLSLSLSLLSYALTRYDEERFYRNNYGTNPGWNTAWGHFTQVIWKGSTRLGCAQCRSLYVCQYAPAGNYMGQFAQNVLPPA